MISSQTNNNKFKLNKRLVIIILAILLVLLLAWLLWWWLQTLQGSGQQKLPPAKNVVVTTPTTPVIDEPVVLAVPENPQMLVVARVFTERFGSYSNQSDYQNIKDSWPLMTGSLRNQFPLTPVAPTDDYIGIDTRVLKVEVINQSASQANVLVKTQRSKRTADLQEQISYQDLKLDLQKSGDSWLVNQAVWQ